MNAFKWTKDSSGFEYLYSAGYIHRDPSLGNLIDCDDGNCKISDFEYARPYIFPEDPDDDSDKGIKAVQSFFFQFYHAFLILFFVVGDTGVYGYRSAEGLISLAGGDQPA